MGKCGLFILVLILQTGLAAQDPEAEMARKAMAERNAHQRLVLLHEWIKAYPQSSRRRERNSLLLRTQKELGRTGEMLPTVRQMAQEDPGGSGGVLLCVYTVNSRINTPAVLDEAERSAKAIEGQGKPGNMDVRNQEIAHRTLGWIALMRSDYDGAEREFTSALRQNSKDGEVSYWLGSSYLAQNQKDKALFHLMRASQMNGPDAVPSSVKRNLRPFLDKLYREVHGNAAGLETLRRTSQNKVFP